MLNITRRAKHHGLVQWRVAERCSLPWTFMPPAKAWHVQCQKHWESGWRPMDICGRASEGELDNIKWSRATDRKQLFEQSKNLALYPEYS
jgi:hypothetical protein